MQHPLFNPHVLPELGGGGRPLRPRKDSMEHAGQHEGKFVLDACFRSERAEIVRHELLPSETRRAMELPLPQSVLEHFLIGVSPVDAGPGLSTGRKYLGRIRVGANLRVQAVADVDEDGGDHLVIVAAFYLIALPKRAAVVGGVGVVHQRAQISTRVGHTSAD